jgi:hypothetical protein
MFIRQLIIADTLVEENSMTKETAKVILDNFDKSIVDNFQTQVSQHEQSDTEITVCVGH